MTADDGTRAFYDAFADDYDAIFADWDASIAHQADVLQRLLGDARTVLDATCGIGTQALGLAMRGYVVAGRDLSPRLVARARAAAAQRGLDVAFAVADVRDARAGDAAIALDNALPHLLDDDDMLRALTGLRASVRRAVACARRSATTTRCSPRIRRTIPRTSTGRRRPAASSCRRGRGAATGAPTTSTT